MKNLPFKLSVFLLFICFVSFLGWFFNLHIITNILLLILSILTIIINYFFVSKKLETGLEEDKSLCQSLFNNSTIGLYQTTPNGKILSANPTLVKMLEFDSMDELLKRDLTEGSYIDINRRKEFKKLLEQNGNISNFESQWFTKTGKIITVEEGAKAIKDKNGTIIRYDGVVENISALKATINKLKISEKRLNLVLDSNNIGIWTLNLEDHAAFRTIQHDRIFGYSELLPNWTYEHFLEHVHDFDKNLVEKSFKNSMDEGIPWNFECRIYRNDGALRWIKACGNHDFNTEGKIIEMSGIVQDITDHKLKELEIIDAKNELEDIFKNDISANFSVSIDAKILNCNRAFLKLFKFKSLEHVNNKNIVDLFADPLKRDHLLTLILQNKKVTNVEVDFITLTGEKINCLANLVGIFDSYNNLLKTKGYLVDITKLKKYEHNLTESEQRFKLASLATNEVIWERNLSNQTFWRSDNFEKVFGWNNDSFGYTDNDIKRRMHPKDLDRVSDKIYNFFNSANKSWEDTYRMQKADGTYAWVYDRAYKLNDENGNSIKVLGSMSNITNDVFQKQQLKQSEENYKNILENALIGVYKTDLKGNILFTNQYIKDQSGYSLKNEIDSINILDLYVYPEKRDELMAELKQNGFVKNYEVAFYSKDKQILYCLMNAKIFNDVVIGMLLDISTIKHHELELSKLSKAIDQSPVSILITNLKSEIEYANPKTTETTGYSLNELLNSKTNIFKSGEKPLIEYKELWETLLSGNEWFGEFHNKKKNGELFWEKASISPVLDSNQNISHFIAIKEDITKQKEILNELTISKEKAEESDRLKSAFLANMSHEIRTPMNGILGFSELLKSPNLSIEKQQKYIEIIKKSGSRMLSTINDIMDISRIEAKLVTVYNKEVFISKQIDEIYAFFQPEAAKKGLTISKTYTENYKDLVFKSDPDKIYAIIQNLVKNAIKFTKKGAIDIGFFVEKNTLNVYVTDTGIGIPLNRQPFVFDRFVQADIEDKEVYEGSGLGLAISRSYAQMLEGDIQLKSEEGLGSTFTFMVPLKNSINTNSNAIDTVIKSTINNSNEIKNLNILIVDDENLVQLFLQEILFKKANELYVANNGIEAIEIFKSNPSINLILLDIQMPFMNGYEVARQIRMFNTNVVIIAQTAFVQAGDREKALDAGCTDYISKPIDKLELFSKIENNFNLIKNNS